MVGSMVPQTAPLLAPQGPSQNVPPPPLPCQPHGLGPTRDHDPRCLGYCAGSHDAECCDYSAVSVSSCYCHRTVGCHDPLSTHSFFRA